MKKTFTSACQSISRAYETLHCTIYHSDDLKRYGLTLSDYYASLDIMNDLRKPGSHTDTFISAVAEFFRSFGFTVIPKGIGYEISI
jgi:hypothetical protein